MCGRYTIIVTMEELMLRFLTEQTNIPYHRPKYNVAPGQMVLAVISDGSKNRIGELKWGLVPQWANDEKIGYSMINARAETIAGKPAFKIPFERKRCLIPADGFYEWKKTGNEKQPMRITLEDGGLFAMAGLYDTWTAPDGRKVSSCTVVTTVPNRLMEDIHDRMPVILRPEDEALWLDRSVRDANTLQPLLTPYPAERMRAYPVAKAVGNVKNDDPHCIEEITI